MILARSRILIIDPDMGPANELPIYLNDHGFKTYHTATGNEGLREADLVQPALILVEARLTDMSGFKVLSGLKESPNTRHIPVIFYSAQADPMDRIVGFELGAEDYVVKPTSERELTLRIRRAINRQFEEAKVVSDELKVGKLRLLRSKVEVWAGNQPILLAALEFKLLALLMSHPGEVQSRERLLAEVWGYNIRTKSRTLYTHIDKLRSKLGACGNYIENVRNVGFRVKEPARQISIARRNNKMPGAARIQPRQVEVLV